MELLGTVSRIQLYDVTGSPLYSPSLFKSSFVVRTFIKENLQVHLLELILHLFCSISRTASLFKVFFFFFFFFVFYIFVLQGAANWLQVLSYYNYFGTVTLVANRWEKTLASRRNVTEAEAKLCAHRSGALYAEVSCSPDMREYSFNAVETALRFALFAVTKKDSLVLEEVKNCIDAGRLSLALKQRLLAQLASSSEDNTSEESGQRKGLFQRSFKRPPIFAAIESKAASKVSGVLSLGKMCLTGFDPETKLTPLMLAWSLCNSQGTEVAEVLMNGCSSNSELFNVQNTAGDTALLIALRVSGNKESSMILRQLWLSSDVSIANGARSNAFHVACEKCPLWLLQLLQDTNMNPLPASAFAVNSAGETPCFLAARSSGSAALVQFFASDRRVADHVRSGVLLYSCLHVAVLSSNCDVVRVLLESPHLEHVVNAVNKEQYTPLYLALEMANEQMKTLLLNCGADLRIGRPHQLQAQVVRTMFVPAHLAWCKTRPNLKMVNLSCCQLLSIPPALFLFKSTLESLDLSNNMLEVLPRQILELAELRELKLSNNLLRSGVNVDLLGLTRLRVLELDGNPKLSRDIGPLLLCHITAARSLVLSGLNLSELTGEVLSHCAHVEEIALNDNMLSFESLKPVFGLTNLTCLWLHTNQITSFCDVPPSVEKLQLSSNKLKALPSKMGQNLREVCICIFFFFEKKKQIWLENNNLTQLHVESIGPSVRRLWLDNNQISSIIPDVGADVRLDCLSVKNNVLTEVPSVFITSLTRLWLDGNLISHLPAAFSTMVNLVCLSLSENPLREFPVQIASLKNLSELSLNDCLLEQLDVRIGYLGNLRKLALRNNRLSFLPQTIGLMTGLAMIELQGNATLMTPPPATVRNGTQAVVGFLHDLIADSKPSFRMKLMVVGQEAVGKTSLTRALISKAKKTPMFSAKRVTKTLSTDGVDIEQWDRKVKMPNGEVVKINFRAWDFAGQEVYYSTHTFFLTNRAVYVVVWSLTESEDSQRVVYWLQSIQSRCAKAPVMLVGTHADLAPNLPKDYGKRVCDKFRERFPELNIVGFTPFSPTNSQSLQGDMFCFVSSFCSELSS
jgi:Leucine-rich repeat (LRR) protein